MQNTNKVSIESKKIKKPPRDQVCNSYLESYRNFAKASSTDASTAEKVLAQSKKGVINKTLAALDAMSPTQERNRKEKNASDVAGKIRPESTVRRGIGDCGVRNFAFKQAKESDLNSGDNSV